MKDMIVITMMINDDDDDDVAALLTPTPAAPCVAAIVSLSPHIRHDLAHSRNTLMRPAQLRPPRLGNEHCGTNAEISR